MTRLTEQEVITGFQFLGLETEEERSKYVFEDLDILCFEIQEFTRLDNATSIPEDYHAELARTPE